MFRTMNCAAALVAAVLGFAAQAAAEAPELGSQPIRSPCKCDNGLVVPLGTGLYQRVPFSIGVSGSIYEVCSLDRDGVHVAVDGTRHPLWKNSPVRVQGQSIVFVNQATVHSNVCVREVGTELVDDGF